MMYTKSTHHYQMVDRTFNVMLTSNTQVHKSHCSVLWISQNEYTQVIIIQIKKRPVQTSQKPHLYIHSGTILHWEPTSEYQTIYFACSRNACKWIMKYVIFDTWNFVLYIVLWDPPIVLSIVVVVLSFSLL